MTESTRLPLLDDESVASRARELGIEAKFLGLNVWRTLLANPTVTKRVYELTTGLLFDGTIDARLRELIILRLGWRTRSEYEWSQHWIMAMRCGVSSEEGVAVRDWESAHFDSVERAVLAAVDAMVDHGTIDSSTWAELRSHFPDDREIVELLAVIANWRMVSSLLRALDVPLDGMLETWPPDGSGPDE
jgi:alkylhydroperoxidase family enzyme